MFRQVIYCIVTITIFVSTTFGQKSSVKPRKASILYCDSSTLNKYKTELANDTHRSDTGFIRIFFAIIHKFNGKPLDTTIITSSKLDEKGSICKIKTRIYSYDSTVLVESRLTMNHKLLWTYSFKNPFSNWMGLFGWKSKNPWVYFTTGVYKGPPEFVDYKSTESQIMKSFPPDGKMVINNDISDSKNKGISITEKQFRGYLKNFKGDLFAYGDFAHRECLYIWYSPAKRFVLFYAP